MIMGSVYTGQNLVNTTSIVINKDPDWYLPNNLAIFLFRPTLILFLLKVTDITTEQNFNKVYLS